MKITVSNYVGIESVYALKTNMNWYIILIKNHGWLKVISGNAWYFDDILKPFTLEWLTDNISSVDASCRWSDDIVSQISERGERGESPQVTRSHSQPSGFLSTQLSVAIELQKDDINQYIAWSGYLVIWDVIN